MKTIGYARVSTTGQSLDAQLEQLDTSKNRFSPKALMIH